MAVGRNGLLPTAAHDVADGQSVTVGLRPQDCRMAAEGERAIGAEVVVFENVLEFGLATLDVPGLDGRMVAQTPSDVHCADRRAGAHHRPAGPRVPVRRRHRRSDPMTRADVAGPPGERFDQLLALTAEVGDPVKDYVILAEGNTSSRIDERCDVVKASGVRLEHATGPDAFVAVRAGTADARAARAGRRARPRPVRAVRRRADRRAAR